MSHGESLHPHDRRIAEALLEISYAVGSVMEIDDILQHICDIGARTMGTDTCSVYLREKENSDWIQLRATHGLSIADELGVRGFHWGQGVPGWSAAHNQAVVLTDIRQDPRNHPLDDTREEMSMAAYLCQPIRIQDEVVGLLTVRRRNPWQWNDSEVVFAEIVAKQVAIVLEKWYLYREKIEAERLAAIAISLSEVAHYIKNILASMSGGESIMEEALKDGDLSDARASWGLLKRSTRKIYTLVENMLLFSRQGNLEMEETNIAEFIAMMADDIRDTARQQEVDLVIDVAPGLPTVNVDPNSFHDVLLNLLSNALDAVSRIDGPRIVLSATHDVPSGRVRVAVADNGTGIPEEVQGRIFDLFFSTKGRKGSGIGLAVCRKIIKEHGGTLRFETSQGEGTTFIIELPKG